MTIFTDTPIKINPSHINAQTNLSTNFMN